MGGVISIITSFKLAPVPEPWIPGGHAIEMGAYMSAVTSRAKIGQLRICQDLLDSKI